MKHLETSIPGLAVIVCGVLLFLLGDGKEQSVISAGALVIGGLGLLNAADASKVDRNGSD